MQLHKLPGKINRLVSMNINIQRREIIVVVLFFFLISDCKKSSSDHRFDGSIQLKLDANGLQYIQLDIGKYFIYKDSASGVLDSVVVTKSLLENKFTPAVTGGPFATYAAYNSEIFSLTLTKMDVNSETVWLEAQTSAALCCPSLSNNNEPVQMYESNGALVFCYPKEDCDFVDLISSLTVEGKVYQNVIMVTGGTDGTSKYYWAKGIGLIKRTETNSDNKTRTLIMNN
jgi:hypothetical protein